MGILTRLFGFLVPERELTVEPRNHPYYPGEPGYDGGGLVHEEWCSLHWNCCGYCQCGVQDDADFGPSDEFLSAVPDSETP